jgi:ubiquitin-protein ligase
LWQEEVPEEEDMGSYDEEEEEPQGAARRRANKEGDESSGWETVSGDEDAEDTDGAPAAGREKGGREKGGKQKGGKAEGASTAEASAMAVVEVAMAEADVEDAASASARTAGALSSAVEMETQPVSQRAEEEGEEHYDTAEDMEEEEADTMEEAGRLTPPSEPISAPPAVPPAASAASAATAAPSTAAAAAPAAAPAAAAAAAAAPAPPPPPRALGTTHVAAWRDAAADAELEEVERFSVEEGAVPDDHHFAAQGSSDTPKVAAFAKTCQKQWKLLQAGLPAGIYVAAFAERVDLMRALVMGPPGTPYEDAVFVFDLQLPPDFPQQPPAVHYISHAERINPNLYENGKVCLSLLGTWTGRQSCELWNPESSTVLQARAPAATTPPPPPPRSPPPRPLHPPPPHAPPQLPCASQPPPPPPPRGRCWSRSRRSCCVKCPTSTRRGERRRAEPHPRAPSPHPRPQPVLSPRASARAAPPAAPRYEKQQGTSDGAHHARRYNEGAMLLSLKSVMNTLRAPSPPFVALTALHFRAARRRIAGRCCKLLELKADADADADAPTPGAAAAGAAAGAAAASEGGEAGKAAAAAAGVVVAEAGLEGVLNTMPSLGFLHSLQRVLPALERALAAVGDGAATAAVDEQD